MNVFISLILSGSLKDLLRLILKSDFWNISLFYSRNPSVVLLQVEKQRAELSRELDELTDRLEEAGGFTATQVNYIWHH